MKGAAPLLLAGGGLLWSAPLPALAQGMDGGPSLQLEAASDERRRGLSWSDGAPVLKASASLPVGSALAFDIAATSLWGSGRHGGADAAIDVGARYARQAGAFRGQVLGGYHAFPGASGMGYGEIGGGIGYQFGPAVLDLFARYAPDQSALGGDNLVLGSALSIGIPRTPLTLSAHLARSSGKSDDPARSRRLRPDGTYWDHGVALDYHRGRWSAGLRYADSSIDRDAAVHGGPRLIARIALEL